MFFKKTFRVQFPSWWAYGTTNMLSIRAGGLGRNLINRKIRLLVVGRKRMKKWHLHSAGWRTIVTRANFFPGISGDPRLIRKPVNSKRYQVRLQMATMTTSKLRLTVASLEDHGSLPGSFDIFNLLILKSGQSGKMILRWNPLWRSWWI